MKQEDRSVEIRRQAMVLYSAYRIVAAKVAPVPAGGLPGVPADSAELLEAKADFGTVAGRITVDTGENQPGTADYLGAVRQMLLSCLAVTTRGADGRQLLAGLAASPKAAIIIDLRHKLNPSSLLAYGPDSSVSQYAKPAAPLTGDIPMSARGSGSHGYLGVPVWLDGDVGSTEAGPLLFKRYLPVDRAHERIPLGSLFFGGEIGLPDRYGHSGLSLDFLSSKSEAAVDSLAELSRIP